MKYLTTLLFLAFLLPNTAQLSPKQDHNPLQQQSLKGSEILPVTILEFRGKIVLGQYILLNWAVRDEDNVDYYEVQKIVQGFWTPIDRVEANGGDEYNYQDPNIDAFNIYRLKVVDLDESFAFSDQVRIKSRRLASPFSVFPNPFTESFKIINENQDYSYKLYDTMGNLKAEGESNAEIEDASFRLSKGAYILQVIDKTTQLKETIKIRKN